MAMMQIDAVLQMLQPSFDVRSISAKRKRNGSTVIGAGAPARWRLNEAAD
jgi:hypothetical protein